MGILSKLFGGNHDEQAQPSETTPWYQRVTDQEYNQRKRQESEDHDAGWRVGGPLDETKSKQYQYGQLGRMETDGTMPAGKNYCSRCGWFPVEEESKHYH